MTVRQTTRWAVLLAVTLAGRGLAADWPHFRGPGTRGVSEETGLPVTWSETENLAWKTALPGPGSSSPVTVGDRVFVTCYSGYGLDKKEPGDPNALKRHIVCLRATDGKVLWDRSVAAVLPEAPYRGQLPEHGYASPTPATDGRNVYVFFGKSGALAFDLDGRQLWQRSLGTGSDQKLWGSAASVAIDDQLVFVNAWDESKTFYALDKATGQEVWKKDLSETGLSFTTPVWVDEGQGRGLLVASVPTQLWGLEPASGDVRWFVRTGINDDMIPTPLVVDGLAYVHGGGPREYGSLAVRLGGRGDVTDTHVLWSSKKVGSPPSSVIVDGLMYCVHTSGEVFCMETDTGQIRYSQKLPVDERWAIYASPVAAEGRFYVVTRKAGTFVVAARPEFQIIAHNRLGADESNFNASPAISNKRLFLRSERFLYCIQKDG